MSNENIKTFAFSERYVINLLFTNMGVGEGKEGGGGEKRHPFTIGESFNIKPVHFCRCVWVV